MITFSDPNITISFPKTGNEDTIIEALKPTKISGKFTMKITKKSKAFRELLDWLQIIKLMNELEETIGF